MRGFARHWSAHDSQTEIPPYGLLPFRPRRAHPYLYSEDEIRQLLHAALQLPSAHGLRRIEPTTACWGCWLCRACASVRRCNLQTEDVDLKTGILTVRGTKFGKSRLVPIHPSTRRVLSDYESQRDRFLSRRPDDLLRVRPRHAAWIKARCTAHVLLAVPADRAARCFRQPWSASPRFSSPLCCGDSGAMVSVRPRRRTPITGSLDVPGACSCVRHLLVS